MSLTAKNVFYLSKVSLPSASANSVQVLQMCQAFALEGYQITLIAPAGKDPKSAFASEAGILDAYGIKVPFPICWLPQGRNGAGKAYLVRGLLYAVRNRAELLFTRSLDGAAFCSMTGVPTIYEVHAPPGGRLAKLYLRLFVAANGSGRLVTISQALKEIIARCLKPGDGTKIVVAPDGVDLGRYSGLPSCEEIRRQLKLEDEAFIAGYSGGLYPGRGIEVILKLAKACPQMTFLVAGASDDSVSKDALNAELSTLRNVRYVGFLANKEVPLYQSACDVLLMPYQRRVAVRGGSDTSAFCSPLKMFEYMAAGRPIISSNLPVLREVLSEDNCILCEPDDFEAWLKAIQWVASHRQDAFGLAAKAQADAAGYSWTSRVRRILEQPGGGDSR